VSAAANAPLDAPIDSLLRVAARRLRVERARAALARAALVLLAALPLVLLWHALLAPVPWSALAFIAALAPLAALLAAAGAVTPGAAAEWIDRRLDGATTFGTLLEYAQDPRPAAVQLRASARPRAAACAARLARLPYDRSLARPLSWAALAWLVAAAVLGLTERRAVPAAGAPAVTRQADRSDDVRPGSADARSTAAGTRAALAVATGDGSDPSAVAATELHAVAKPGNAAAGLEVAEAEAKAAGPALVDGDSSSGRAPGREAGSGLDRGGAGTAAAPEARLAVELHRLLREPMTRDQRARSELEGRYDDPPRLAPAAEREAQRPVAAALPPRPLERTALDPATAAFVRAYSSAGPR
jgi:hypothetical protein